MRFDLVDLNLFRHIVEAGSITQGAERAHLALAAASTRVRHMERALGAALLVRGRQGVAPTQAGRTLLQHARGILRQAERLHEEERLSDEIVGLIAEGVGDIGIVAGTVEAGTLETFPFRRDRFVLVVARDHPLAKRTKIGFARVLEHDFVGLERGSALQRFLAAKAARIGRVLRLRVQLRSFDAVCRLVACNVGIGIVPQTTARRAAKMLPVATVALTDAWAPRELTICVRNFAELPPFARQFVEHLRAGA